MSKVLCAANAYFNPDGSIIVSVCGRRHWDTIMHSQVSCFDEYLWNCIQKTEIQGFIDTDGNFLTREEAFIIATENNQIIHKCGSEHTGKLYSENLY